MVFDSFQMPLVSYNHNGLAFSGIDLPEEVCISLVNEDFFELWEKDICCLDVPVN
jgi:hypothetical protein